MSYINDGHQTLYSFSLAPSVSFKEKSITPPGMDHGGGNDTTTMRNNNWRTMQPKHLKSLTPSRVTASYDPVVYNDIVSMMGVNQQITITFPDGSTVLFWGWLDSFVPGELVEGSQPTAEVVIMPSNQDNSNVETAPVYTAP